MPEEPPGPSPSVGSSGSSGQPRQLPGDPVLMMPLSLHSPLSLEKGKRLMGDVARLLQVPPSVFEDIE